MNRSKADSTQNSFLLQRVDFASSRFPKGERNVTALNAGIFHEFP
jgi:hypothetical protein